MWCAAIPTPSLVNVVEKRPFALWQSPDGIAVVERAGSVITTQDVEKFRRLPKLVGAGAPGAAADHGGSGDGASRRRLPASRLMNMSRSGAGT